jgi:outer membrane protein W
MELRMSLKKISLVAAITASLAIPYSQADVGAGVGITYVFGQGIAVGVKAFTDDKEDKAVGSVGIDYMLSTKAWRPNVGIGYLNDNIYTDATAGYDLQQNAWTFGLGAGAADTEERVEANPAAPALPF